MRKRPLTVYLIYATANAFIMSLIFTVDMIYQVRVVGLTPLQLALMGTILEVSIFLFEVPTGILADLHSRRLSILVGLVIMGAGFMLEGLVPLLWTVSLAQVLWGLGYTFTSGAVEAWVADEVGEDRAGDAFMQGAQGSQIGALLAVPLSVIVGLGNVAAPIWIGGAALIALAVFLSLTMGEHGFTPAPRDGRSHWAMLRDTASDAQALVGRQPLLLGILGIGFFMGLHSEGYDRLWTAHLLQDFDVAWFSAVDPVVPLGIVRGVSLVITTFAVGAVRKRLNAASARVLGRSLAWLTGATMIGIALFAAVGSLELALALYVVIHVVRHLMGPLQTAWLNLRIDDSSVRATFFSVAGQVDAIGQIAGGPIAGAVGNLAIRAALALSAALLVPALPLYRWINKRQA